MRPLFLLAEHLANEYVCVRRDTAGQGREETLDLEAGEQHLLQYAAIAHLIESGTVTLT